MGFLRNLFFLKPTVKGILIDLAKITDIKILSKSEAVKPLTLQINKNIIALPPRPDANTHIGNYSKIIKGLQDLSALLENISFEISFHKIKTTEILKILLKDLRESLTILANYASSNKKQELITLKQKVSKNLKEIRLAKLNSANENDNFIENLKFSSIYARAEACFLAADDIAEAMAEIDFF